MGAFINLTGSRYGKLYVLEKSDRRAGGQIHWACVCDCGTITEVAGNSLRHGRTKSCGCGQISTTHGMSSSRAYRLFTSTRYSARKRGLEHTISPAELSLPEVCPVLGITITYDNPVVTDSSPSVDRIDNSKGYISGNCRVISNRANRIKSSGTVEELESILRYMKTAKKD